MIFTHSEPESKSSLKFFLVQTVQMRHGWKEHIRARLKIAFTSSKASYKCAKIDPKVDPLSTSIRGTRKVLLRGAHGKLGGGTFLENFRPPQLPCPPESETQPLYKCLLEKKRTV